MRTLLLRPLLLLLWVAAASFLPTNALKTPKKMSRISIPRGGDTRFEANLPVPVVNYKNIKIIELFGLEFRVYYFCASDPHETAKFKRISSGRSNKYLELDFTALRFAGADEIQYSLDCKIEVVKKEKKRGFLKRLFGIEDKK